MCTSSSLTSHSFISKPPFEDDHWEQTQQRKRVGVCSVESLSSQPITPYLVQHPPTVWEYHHHSACQSMWGFNLWLQSDFSLFLSTFTAGLFVILLKSCSWGYGAALKHLYLSWNLEQPSMTPREWIPTTLVITWLLFQPRGIVGLPHGLVCDTCVYRARSLSRPFHPWVLIAFRWGEGMKSVCDREARGSFCHTHMEQLIMRSVGVLSPDFSSVYFLFYFQYKFLI